MDTKEKCPSGELKIRFKAKGHKKEFRDALAFLNGKLVGVFSFRVQGGLVAAHGTRVLPEFQRRGIGIALWTAMFEKYKPEHVAVGTISRAGENLVLRMKILYPDISWDWW
jgi:GNAT superfamily N-acetyltransferase